MPIPARDVALGSRVPWFRIRSVDDPKKELTPTIAWDEEAERWKPLLVMFICSHSPYVKHIQQDLRLLTDEYQARGLTVIAISPNDPVSYPSDGADKLCDQIRDCEFTFPYALDENQTVARAFEASCTPEFFLYGSMDRGGRLVYHGQYDATRPGRGADATGDDLRRAIEAVLVPEAYRDNQKMSFGCSVKWKPGLDATAALALG